tara:strand:+ start:88 stop:381 length:294 start_codon:yes stop_codon:yes gene_type:complete
MFCIVCANQLKFFWRCRSRKELCRDIVSGEEIRLACIDTTQKRKEKTNTRPGEITAKYFSNVKINGKKVSNRRVTEDKYGRIVGELSLNRENIQELL